MDDQDGSVDMGVYSLWIRINNEGGCFDYLM